MGHLRQFKRPAVFVFLFCAMGRSRSPRRSPRRSPPRRDRRRSPSSSSTPPRKKLGRSGGAFGEGGGGGSKEAPVKVGVYKEIDDEEKRRAQSGEPALTISEKDAMFRN